MKHQRPTQRTHQGTRKETRQYWKGAHADETGAWRDDETVGIADCELRIADLGKEQGAKSKDQRLSEFDTINPDARERSRLLRLLGLINYRILTGNRVYVEVGGIVYKTLYGGYLGSGFSSVEA